MELEQVENVVTKEDTGVLATDNSESVAVTDQYQVPFVTLAVNSVAGPEYKVTRPFVLFPSWKVYSIWVWLAQIAVGVEEPQEN